MRLSSVVPTLAGMAAVLAPFLWCRARGEDTEAYGLSWSCSRKCLAECAAVTFFVLSVLTMIAMNWPGEDLPRYSPFRRTFDFAAAGIAAAVIEEIFFRGWLQTLFRKRLGAVASVFLTSVIFAASHVFAARAAFIFAVFFPGCVMGALKERHGSIATSTLFHACGNLWAIWFVPSHFPSIKEWIELSFRMTPG